MTLKIDRFGGIAPRQHPTQLADGMATVAKNVKLESGKLVPLRQPRLVEGAANLMENGLTDVAAAQSMHIWRRNGGGFDFLLFPGMTWAAPGNIASDDLTRLVVSGATGEGESSAEPVIYFRSEGAKVVKPLAKTALPAPIVSRTSQVEPGENKRYTRFFIAWVDAFGFESPISPPSLIPNPDYDPSVEGSEQYLDEDLEYDDGDEVNIAKPATIPEDAKKIRVYKVITGSEEGRVQFIYEVEASEVEVSSGGFNFAVRDEDAGEVMPEIENPPDGLQDILDVPGAFYVGFAPSAPKTVCFSEVDMLYSWPTAYRYDIADNIVALAVTSNSVFALTDGWPYVLTGTAPESMTVAKLASPAACVSARGVTVLRNTVFYASNAGLMAISNSANEGTVVTNLTEQIFTKDQWQEMNPKSCLLGHHNGRLFMYFTKEDGSHVGLTFNFSDGLALAVTTHDETAKCLCVDNAEDRMYFVREGV